MRCDIIKKYRKHLQKVFDITGGFFMKWSRDNSITLSKVCILVFASVGILSAFWLPIALDGIVRRRGWGIEERIYFITSFYCLMIPAAIALGYLYRLLLNIGKEKVFVESNVKCLRKISWACYLAAVICMVSSFYYLPFVIVAAAACFMGLILRVVKNVFAEAVAIKQENDFTI